MIRFEGVVKEFGGPLARLRGDRVRALDGVTLHAPPGEALGIVGPNGAGKSTLLGILLGFLRPTRGAAEVEGELPRLYAERHGIAYVPDRPAIPPGWTVRGALEAFAALGEVDDSRTRIEAELARFGLEPVARRRVAALSRGNLQRLAFAQALLGPRRILVMDEGTSGLDAEWAARVRGIVTAWRAEDPARVVVFASHDLEEVEAVADRVAILANGRVREVVDLAAARAAPPRYRLAVEGAGCDEAVRAAFPGAEAAGPPGAYLLPAGAAVEAGVASLLSRGCRLRALAPATPTLRERYRAAPPAGEGA